jgi:hypothetical protein
VLGRRLILVGGGGRSWTLSDTAVSRLQRAPRPLDILYYIKGPDSRSPHKAKAVLALIVSSTRPAYLDCQGKSQCRIVTYIEAIT